MLLTGTFERSLDEKLRLAIPKRFRQGLGESATSCFIAPATDRALGLYSNEAFERLGQRLAEAPPTQHDVRAFSRLFYSQAEELEIDTQGRVRIPARLAALAGLRREVMVLGVQDHLELWDRQRWLQYVENQGPRYDELAEAAFTPEARQAVNEWEVQ